jgi:hypothetical protein
MTKRRVAISAIALVATAFGSGAVVAAFLFDDLSVLARLGGACLGLLFVAGGWLVFLERRVGVALLWVGAAIYTFVNFVPALERHGTEAFSVLMNMFYVSVGLRVALATAAHLLVRPRHG